MIICCAGCDKHIMDKFLLTVLDRTWHAECVRCVDCGANLTEKCFSREGKLFCKEDFFRRFGTKCSGCLQGIAPNDMVRRASDRVFHLRCFTCCVCRKQIKTGDELYVLDENRFICKTDFLNCKSMAGMFIKTENYGPQSEDDEEESLDIKPHIHSQDTKPQLHSRPNPSISVSPLNLPPPMQTSSVTSPSSNTNSPLIGPSSASSLVGLLGRSSPNPSQLGMMNTPTPSGTPLHDGMVSDSKLNLSGFNVGMTDTPPSEKDASVFHDSDGSDIEGSNDAKDSTCPDGTKIADDEKGGNKRRGPRTTIKAKQLEVLKTAFSATPKPTRHIREQLAKETGLPMRVIQVWFQNKRSKERRMKQLSSLGRRAHLFANPRKLRGMRMSPGLEDGYGYYGDAFGYPPQGFHEYFPGQGPPPPGIPFPHGLPPSMEQPLPPGGPMGDFGPIGSISGPPISEGPFMNPPGDLMSQRASPDSMLLSHGGQGNFDHQNEGLVW